MGTGVLGWILIVLGVIATAAGVGGGIAQMFKDIKKAADAGAFAPVSLPTDLIKALTEFLKELVKAPVWLALIIIGLTLIGWGGTMI